VNLFRTRFAKGEAKEIIAPQKLSGNGCSQSLQGKRCRIDYMIYNQSCGTDGALSRKQKNTEMSELISVFFCFSGLLPFRYRGLFRSSFGSFLPRKEQKKELYS